MGWFSYPYCILDGGSSNVFTLQNMLYFIFKKQGSTIFLYFYINLFQTAGPIFILKSRAHLYFEKKQGYLYFWKAELIFIFRKQGSFLFLKEGFIFIFKNQGSFLFLEEGFIFILKSRANLHFEKSRVHLYF